MPISQNVRGALLMALAMATFTCNDGLVKSVTSELSIAQIMAIRGLMTTILVYFVVRATGGAGSFRFMLHPLVLLRSACEICASLTFLTALATIKFANASAILQSLPLAVTFGAALFFGEPVGWRRWLAIGVGFVGVLIILKPGPDGFVPASLLVVAAVFFTAGRDLATRRMGAEIPTLMVTLFAALSSSLVGMVLIVPMGGWAPVSADALIRLALAAVLAFVGYQAIIMSMRGGEISFIAPFRYTSLICAIAIGILFFDEKPDTSVLLGAMIVIGSGLYALYRETKRRPVAVAPQEG